MATATTSLMTAEEFFDWANRPENEGKRYELEDGEVVEMPPPGEAHAMVCWFVITVLTDYIRRRGAGHLLTNDCGLVVRRGPDTVRGPDIMYFPESRQLEQADRGHVERVPQLVVEVFSPSDKAGRLNARIKQYHKRGVPVVWVAYPEDRSVDVHYPGQSAETLKVGDALDGGDTLSDFRCPVADLFALPGSASA